MSELDLAESSRLEGELMALKNSIASGKLPEYLLNIIRPYMETLTKRYEALTQDGQLGNSKEEEKKKQELINIVGAKIADDHERFVSQGFNSKDDFFTFGKNLENDEYWNWLNENPDEKKKVGEKAVDGLREMWKAGKREDVLDILNNATPRQKEVLKAGGLPEFLNEIGLSQSGEAKKITQDVEKMAGREKVEAHIENNIAQAASVARDDENGTKEITLAREGSKQGVRDAVIAKADKMGIDNKYAKGSDDEFASYFEMPDAKAAANNLKESQNLVANTNKTTSSPTEVQIAQNDTGKSGGFGV